MSSLKNKSEINYNAAKFLHKNNYFPSVIHCSYYCCVQLMKHLIISRLGITETKIDLDSKANQGSSHEYMINLIVTYLKENQKDNIKLWKIFNDDINDLKKLRVIADYKNLEVDSKTSYDSIKLCETICKSLKQQIS